MRTRQQWLKQIAKLGLVLTLSANLSACASFLGLGGDSWKEEVLLHDGRKIIVERSQTYGGRHEIGRPPPIKEHTIEFSIPNSSKTIEWKSEYGEDIGRTNFNLLAMHVLNNTPYVVASPNLCMSYNKWGRPNPPYVFFKYDGKEWQRVSLDEFPVEFKILNIAIYLGGQDVEAMVKQGLVSAENIKERNSELTQPEYKTIIREPIQSAGTGCGELIFDGRGGWQGPGLFSRQPSKEACLKYCEQRKIVAQYCPCNRFFKGE